MEPRPKRRWLQLSLRGLLVLALLVAASLAWLANKVHSHRALVLELKVAGIEISRLCEPQYLGLLPSAVSEWPEEEEEQDEDEDDEDLDENEDD